MSVRLLTALLEEMFVWLKVIFSGFALFSSHNSYLWSVHLIIARLLTKPKTAQSSGINVNMRINVPAVGITLTMVTHGNQIQMPIWPEIYFHILLVLFWYFRMLSNMGENIHCLHFERLKYLMTSREEIFFTRDNFSPFNKTMNAYITFLYYERTRITIILTNKSSLYMKNRKFPHPKIHFSLITHDIGLLFQCSHN